jgi:hypothetical protein
MADAADYEKYGIRYNYNHGYLNGQEFNWRRNFYHKPIASVNWEYKINESTNLSASAYYSVGRGGGTGDIGRLGGNYASSSRFRNEMTGEVEWDQIVNSNSGQGGNWSGGYSYNNNIDAATGLYIVNDQDERVDGVKRNGFVRRASVNSHNFVGSLINLKKELSEKLTLDFGVDLRNYRGIHYRRLDHLLGADGYRDFDNVNYSGGSAVRTTTYGSNVSDLWNVFKDTDNEEKIDYHNDGFVRWSGVFGQLEYSNDDLSVFVQGAMSNQGFQREEFFNQTPGNQKTDWKNISGGNIKGGANYNINAKSNVYVNAGTYSKQPNFDAVYINYGNNLNPDLRNEKVVGLEAGYGYRSSNFNFNVNIYKTSWKDRFLRDGVRVDGVNGNANYYGIEQVHTGIEFDGVYEISPFVKVEGMLTLGNYEYGGDVTADVFDSSNTFLGSSVIYLDGVKVGDAAQTTSRVNLIVTPSDLFKFNISMFNASDLYADFNVEDFTSPEDEAMMLPSYDLFDFGASYKLDIAGETVYLRANINNIFDNYYFAESATNYEAGPGDNTYLGVNTRNKVFPGWGRTWNVGFTYRF